MPWQWLALHDHHDDDDDDDDDAVDSIESWFCVDVAIPLMWLFAGGWYDSSSHDLDFLNWSIRDSQIPKNCTPPKTNMEPKNWWFGWIFFLFQKNFFRFQPSVFERPNRPWRLLGVKSSSPFSNENAPWAPPVQKDGTGACMHVYIYTI